MLKPSRIRDPIKAQAAIAMLISQGWEIDLARIQKELPGGLQEKDWLDIANGCLTAVLDRLEADKVIPIAAFTRRLNEPKR